VKLRAFAPAERKIAMNSHPYLRAFLAGVFVPTLILPLLLTLFVIVRLVLEEPFPIERGLIFPMAVVPALWGLWNMLHLGLHERTHMSVGAHGAILPLLLLPCGTVLAGCLGIIHLGATSVTWFDVVRISYAFIACGFCAALAGYYLAWKYVVGFLNRVLGIA
jgi:hypothetical protein